MQSAQIGAGNLGRFARELNFDLLDDESDSDSEEDATRPVPQVVLPCKKLRQEKSMLEQISDSEAKK